MNGRYQVGSGRVVTVTHDTPFIDNTVAPKDDGVKMYSDRDDGGYKITEGLTDYIPQFAAPGNDRFSGSLNPDASASGFFSQRGYGKSRT